MGCTMHFRRQGKTPESQRTGQKARRYEYQSICTEAGVSKTVGGENPWSGYTPVQIVKRPARLHIAIYADHDFFLKRGFRAVCPDGCYADWCRWSSWKRTM